MPVSGRWCSPSKQLPVQVAVFLYFAGENMIFVTGLPYIIYGVCRDIFPNASAEFCLEINQHPEESIKIQKMSALYVMVEKMFKTVPPFLMAAFLGPWSDIHGRKLPMLLPFMGNMLTVVPFLLAHYLRTTPVIMLVMAGFFIRSLCGHNILLHLISFSYIADTIRSSGSYTEIGLNRRRRQTVRLSRERRRYDEVPTRRKRTAAPVLDQSQYLTSMSRLQAIESVGIVSGSFCGWLFQRIDGAPQSFCTAAAILFLGMVVVIVWVKETRRPLLQQEILTNTESIPKQCLKNMTRFFNCKKSDLDPVIVWGCFLIMFFTFSCKEGREAVTLPFVEQPPLSWHSALFAAYNAAFSAFQTLFLFIVAPLLQDRTVVIIALLCSTAGGLGMAFTTSTWGMILSGCFSNMIDCTFPALRAILCKNLVQNQVGDVLSRMSAAEALSSIIGPLAIVSLYNYTVDYFPGLAFLYSSAVPAGILLVGAVVETFYQPKTPSRDPSEQPHMMPRDASQRPDFTQSLNVPSATVSGYGFLWCSTEW